MIRIILKGALSSLIDKGFHDCAVTSPSEAVKFLEGVLPDFRTVFRRGNYFLSFDDGETKIDIEHSRLEFGARKKLYILPLASGSKGGGAGQGIAPESSSYEDREDDISALFSGSVNTTEQGLCRPVVYGRVRNAGSAVVSAGISVGADESLTFVGPLP